MKNIVKIITFSTLIACIALGSCVLLTECTKTKKTTATLVGKPPVAPIQEQEPTSENELEIPSSSVTSPYEPKGSWPAKVESPVAPYPSSLPKTKGK